VARNRKTTHPNSCFAVGCEQTHHGTDDGRPAASAQRGGAPAGAEFISANLSFVPMNNSPGPKMGWTGFNLA